MGKTSFLSSDSHNALDVAVPGSEVRISDGPIDAVTVAGVRLEVQIAPPPAGAPPDETSAAQVIAPNPTKLLLRVADVRMRAVVHEEMLRRLTERVVLA